MINEIAPGKRGESQHNSQTTTEPFMDTCSYRYQHPGQAKRQTWKTQRQQHTGHAESSRILTPWPYDSLESCGDTAHAPDWMRQPSWVADKRIE
jgi:hypothetical protein